MVAVARAAATVEVATAEVTAAEETEAEERERGDTDACNADRFFRAQTEHAILTVRSTRLVLCPHRLQPR
jgi:hypothetical protein